MMLSAEELLAGSELTFEIEVPAGMLPPLEPASAGTRCVRLRPLTVRDLQLISRAAKESDSLTATLMVQRALVEPEMTIAQVNGLQAGLLHHLLDEVNRISGISLPEDTVEEALEAPLTRAAFVLAKEFGWTPQQVGELTLGQVLLHLQMLARGGTDG